jgi:transcriptional regulator with XRE-family HTH domain
MQAQSLPEPQPLDARIGSRLKTLRLGAGLTIDGLAAASGVSRAMISRIERGEASPTAALLARLANALGTTLSHFFGDGLEHGPLARAAARPVWRDPATGYLRRAVTPETFPADIVDVTLPAGVSVTYDNAVPLAIEQVVWVLDGGLELTFGDEIHTLGTGDCLQMRLDRPITFRNATARETRYAVVLARGLLAGAVR